MFSVSFAQQAAVDPGHCFTIRFNDFDPPGDVVKARACPPAHSRSLRDSCASTPRDRVQHPTDSPMLMFSVDALFLDAQTSPSQHPKSIHQCLQPATRVINTLMRLVHGGVRVKDGIRTVTRGIHSPLQHLAYVISIRNQTSMIIFRM